MTSSAHVADGRGAHLPAIEGMRALAILLVVAYHAGIPAVSGGYIGVDVFFVLSGYLIIGLLDRELRATGRIALARFWARRARRLLPAAAVVLAVTLAAGSALLPPNLQRQSATAALASAAYVSNLWFAGRATDYLGDESANPLLHTWSLSVEEQFYLVWPLLLAALALPRTGSSRARIAWLAAAVTIASFVWAMVQQPVASSWAFFSPLTRAWEFGLGGLVAIAAHDRAPSERARWLSGLAGTASIVGAAFVFDSGTPMPGVETLLPVLGAALILLGVPRVARASVADPYHWLSTRPMRWVGRVSYSWYLWHWPVGVLFVAALQVDTLAVWLASAMLSLALAEGTRRWVEDPIRFHPALAQRAAPVLAASAAVVLLLAAAAQGSRVHATQLAERFPEAHVAEAEARPLVYSNGCFVAADEMRVPHCISGDTMGGRHVVLVGDSHAAQWYPALEPIARRAGWRLETFTKGACPIGDVRGSGPRAEEESCARWRAAVIGRILESRPALVITANFAHVKWPGDRGGRYLVAEWGMAYRRALVRLDSAAIPTIVLRNPPRPGFDVPACVGRLAQFQRVNPPLCEFDRELPRILEVARQEERAAAGLRHVTLVDLNDRICPGERCTPVVDGQLVYRDRHHLTAGYAASLADDLWQRMSARMSPVRLAGDAASSP
jgi:peptidoglycan/LPS O-acetylase OafA/YrhL